MYYKKIYLPAFFLCLIGLHSYAYNASQRDIEPFRNYKEIKFPGPVPAVVEIPFPEYPEREQFAVVDPNNILTPYYYRKEVYSNKIFLFATANTSLSEASKMTDGNTKTFTEFGLHGDEQGAAKIILTGSEPVVSSSLYFLLDDHVAMPNFVEIKIPNDAGGEKTVLAKTRVLSQNINFPKTTSREWRITFIYGQPLRILELSLSQDNAVKTNSGFLRFLAQPVTTYKIYFNPDRQVNLSAGESGNLYLDKGVINIKDVRTKINPAYVIADSDNDGVPDLRDNCVIIANIDQVDIDNNGKGDACDDFDRDGIINISDNCRNFPNADQTDTDGDKLGDVCDKEESRITERLPWLPWAGIVFAALVIISLFALTAASSKKNNGDIINNLK